MYCNKLLCFYKIYHISIPLALTILHISIVTSLSCIYKSCEAGHPRALRLHLQPCGSSSLPLLFSSFLFFFSISSFVCFFFFFLFSLSNWLLPFFIIFYCLSSRSIAIPTHAAAIEHSTPQSTQPHCNDTASPRPLLLAPKWSIPGDCIFCRRFFNQS